MISNLKPSKFRPARIRWVHSGRQADLGPFCTLHSPHSRLFSRLLPAVWFTYVGFLSILSTLLFLKGSSFFPLTPSISATLPYVPTLSAYVFFCWSTKRGKYLAYPESNGS
ncbi:hypothetical protein F4805DRAFT_199490 [Annulohypoxylon moriforme]|nr:hypothetical protein F4805DRAFT_199490 [Annulohypoxylon moriforme]